MITTAILKGPTEARERLNYGFPGGEVVLFGGMRGCVSRHHQDAENFCVFEVAESGAQYIVPIAAVRFEVRDTTGRYAPIPEEVQQ